MFAVIAAAVIVGGAAAAQSKVDISGSWAFTLENAAGSVPAHVTLIVDGDRITGHISSTLSGEQSFVGAVYASGFQFTFEGDDCQVTLVGRAENSATLKGTFENPGRGGAGTFIATRKP
ncbi:MAG TPA: hypothetical protein VJP86_10945 [Vicinamibacterales bacterium]|jgi:hypothetical protein|nr:hypothetical protein [Vicinamibacterales bacterium]